MNTQSVQMAAPTLSSDKASVVQVFTQTLTQSQLTFQLSSVQAQLAQLKTQEANLNSKIATIQGQLALFVQPINVSDFPVTLTP